MQIGERRNECARCLQDVMPRCTPLGQIPLTIIIGSNGRLDVSPIARPKRCRPH
jgi:hypothetical protein